MTNTSGHLSHIAFTHQIAVAGLGRRGRRDAAPRQHHHLGARRRAHRRRRRSLTLTDIRRNQQKVERRYGAFVLSVDETALRYRYDEAEMMVQAQSLVLADLSDMGRDVPSTRPRRSSALARARRSSSSNDRCGGMPVSGLRPRDWIRSAPAATWRRRRWTSRRTSRRGWTTML
jgi:hypothetical protein